MFDLALKMLLGDRAKYVMLISGLTFAALLMTEQAAIFCGIMQWAGSTLDNVGAPIWVVDPQVEQVNDTEALRDTDLNRVRSVDGVAWAAPFYQGILRPPPHQNCQSPPPRPAPAQHRHPRRIRRPKTQQRSVETDRSRPDLRNQ